MGLRDGLLAQAGGERGRVYGPYAGDDRPGAILTAGSALAGLSFHRWQRHHRMYQHTPVLDHVHPCAQVAMLLEEYYNSGDLNEAAVSLQVGTLHCPPNASVCCCCWLWLLGA